MLNSDMQTIHMSDFKTFHVYRHDFFGVILKLHPILSMKMSSLLASHGFSLAKSPRFHGEPRLGSASRPAAPGPATSLRFLPSPGFGGRSSRTSASRHGHPWRHGHGAARAVISPIFSMEIRWDPMKNGGFDGRKNMKLGGSLR